MSSPDWLADGVAQARNNGEDIAGAVDLARSLGARLPQPGHDTAARWAALAAVSAANLTVARVLEAHSDALSILREAGEPVEADGCAWGVFAAEAPNARLIAEQGRDGVRLHGVKPWCSVAAELDCALVTAHAGEQRQLFRVELRHPTVTPEPARGWVSRGLRTVTSTPVRFDGTPAVAVGPPGWYLIRPGFAWGGLGVAACWHGGGSGLLPALRAKAQSGGDLAAAHLGGADAALHGSGAALAEAARLIDDGQAAHHAGELLALRVRAVVADAVERVLRHAAHALGPAPLAFDAEHAARVADLEVYVRQHHAERDLAALGRLVADA